MSIHTKDLEQTPEFKGDVIKNKYLIYKHHKQ